MASLLKMQNREQLILDNMSLVKHVIKSLSYPTGLYEDLVSEGYIALIKAADTFDEKIGEFSTLGYIIIQRRLIRFLIREKKYIQASHQKLRDIPAPPSSLDLNDIPKLSNSEQKTFDMFVNGMTIKDIAQHNNTTGKYECLLLKRVKNKICKNIGIKY